MAKRKDRKKRFKQVLNTLLVSSLAVGIAVVPQKAEAAYQAWDYGYNGAAQSFTAPKAGTYKLETWGAEGAGDTGRGKGGYSYGEVYLNAGQVLYVYVGGQGSRFNGGGWSTHSWTFNGSGATDFRNASDGNWQDYLWNRLIVAGAGGSAEWAGYPGGAGGGLTGGNGTDHDPYGQRANTTSYGGSQSSGGYGQGAYGSFGQGGYVNSSVDLSGPGGGGWYGGGSGLGAGGGGGGSSYIGGVSKGKTISGAEWMPAPGGGSELGHSWHGYARVTSTVDTVAPYGSVQSPASGTVTNATSYKIRVNVGDGESGINRVQFPTWTEANGQDDMVNDWPNNGAVRGTDLGGGTWEFTVNVGDHGWQDGKYITHVYAFDNAGNNQLIGVVEVNVDRTAPGGASFSPNTTSPTNGNVSMTINYPGDASVKQFYIDGGGWQNYGGAVTITGNTTIHSRSQDAAGNWSVETAYAVNNIDRTPPGAATFSPTVTAPTNGNVGVNINYPGDASVKQFYIDGGGWQNYGGTVTITGNTTIHARSQDAAGNWSGETAYAVSNIDKNPPAGATFAANVTAPTNGNVTVSVNFPSDASVKQYKIDGGAWTNYTAAVSMTGNGTVYGRSQDVAGNWSAETSYTVTNIDKTAPVAATLSANTTAPTNKAVNVTIAYPSDASVKQYKIDGGAWQNYTTPVVLSDNGTVTARSQDSVGNVSAESTYAVSNIDKIAPVVSTFKADITKPTNGNVNVSLTYPSDAVDKEFKVNGGAWQKYTAAVAFSDNGTINARSTDAAGNVSDESSFDVTNIDKIAPNVPTLAADKTVPTNTDVTVTVAFPTDAAQKLVRIGTGSWQNYTAPVVLSANDTVFAKATDEAGNTSAEGSLVVRNIDKIAPNKPTLAADVTKPTNGNVAVAVTFPADAFVKEYKVDNGNWTKYTIPVVLSGNATVYARATDDAGNVSSDGSLAVSNIDITPPADATISASNNKPTNQTVSVAVSFPADAFVKQYRVNGGAWTAYDKAVVFADNGKLEARSQDDAGNWSGVTSYEVKNIDKVAPNTPTLKADNTDPTNKDVTVTISFPTDSFKKEFKLGSGEWTAYTTPVVVPRNDTLQTRAWDDAGNVSEAGSITITNIDKFLPTVPTAQVNADQIIVEKGTDASGIANTLVRIDGGEWAEYTAPITLNDGKYNVELKSVDTVGNENANTVVLYVYDKTLKEMKNSLSYVERFPSPPQSKIDEAKAIADRLPDSAPEKQEMLDRIQALQAKLSKVEVANSLIILQRQVDRGSATTEQIAKWKEEATRLETLINNMPNGKDKDDQQVALTALKGNLKAVEEAMKINNQLDVIKSSSDLSQLVELVNTLPTGSLKDKLNQTIKESNDLIQAKDQVSQLEKSPTSDSLNAQKDAVAKLPASDAKTALLERIQEVQDQLSAKDALGKATGSFSQKDYDWAVESINKVDSPDLKQTMLKELQDIADRVVIVSKVEGAEKSRNQVKIDEARVEANKLPDGVLKDDLLNRLSKIDSAMSTANSLLKIAETSGTASNISKTEEAINKMVDSPQKEELKARLEPLKKQLAEQLGKLEVTNGLSDLQREIDRGSAATTEQIAKWKDEVTRLETLISRMPEGKDKDGQQAVLTALKGKVIAVEEAIKINSQLDTIKSSSDLSKLVELVDTLPNGSLKDKLNQTIKESNDLIQAKDQVSQLEQNPTLESLKEQKDAVAKLPASDAKTALLERIQTVQDQLSANDALNKATGSLTQKDYDWAVEAINKVDSPSEKQDMLKKLQEITDRVAVVSKVEESEKSRNQAKIDEARIEANKLPDGKLKDDLLTRLGKIDSAMNAANSILKIAETSLTASNISKSAEAINKMVDSPQKEELKARLELAKQQLYAQDAVKQVKAATDLVKQVEQYKRDPYLTDAAKAVNALPDGQAKTDLLNRLADLADAMKQSNELAKKQAADKASADQIAQATQKFTQAELYKRNPYLTDAQAVVNALPDGQAKTDLQKRLDNLNEAIRKASEVIKDGQFTPGKDISDVVNTIKDPAAKKVYTNWSGSVIRAEKFFARSNITVALKAMDGVPASVQNDPKYKDLYAEMVQRTNDLKTIYNQLIADKGLETATNKATSAVDFFERYPTLAYKQKAEDAVNAVPDGLIKTSLQKRIAAVTAK